MQRCDNCGNVFEPDDDCIRSELVERFQGYELWEHYFVCPECNSEDIEEFTPPYDDCENEIDCGRCEGKCGNCKFAEQKEAEENEG